MPPRQSAEPIAPTPAALATELGSSDRFVSRARPAFLYVMYVMILAALPLGALAAVWPDLAAAFAAGIAAYLRALPEPLYALFGAGYLGYTAARQWGKVAGSDS